MTTFLFAAGAALLGLLVGSFLNVVIYRTPRGENVVWPGSHCTHCGESLRWYHNIPLLSWLALRGRCAYCHEAISLRYPAIEAINALLWLILYLKIGPHPSFFFVAATFSSLLALSAIDFEYYAVPDSVNFFALGTALLAAATNAWEAHDWQPLWSSLQAAALAAGGLWLLGWLVGKATKKEAMGGADVIVAGTMAALLGLPGFFIALFVAAILAIGPSLMAKDTMVPFVPFLAMGTLIVYLFDQPIFRALESYLYG